VIDEIQEDINETEDDYKELLEENRRLKQLLEEAKNTKAKPNRKFTEAKGLKSNDDAAAPEANLFT